MCSTRLICHALLICLLLSCSGRLVAQQEKTNAGQANQDLIHQLQKQFTEQAFLWLSPPDQEKIFGLYNQEVTGKPQGGILLIHDLYEHPNWDDVIAPLLKALPRQGWSTLSLQIPELMNHHQDQPSEDIFNKIDGKIKTAINQLKNKGITDIVIIGHGIGAILAAAYIVNSDEADVKALIGISIPVEQQWGQKFYSLPYLEKLKLPVLDLFAARDYPNVRNNAEQRVHAAQKSGSITYRQIIILGAKHNFRGMEAILSKRIIGWLRKQTPNDKL